MSNNSDDVDRIEMCKIDIDIEKNVKRQTWNVKRITKQGITMEKRGRRMDDMWTI